MRPIFLWSKINFCQSYIFILKSLLGYVAFVYLITFGQSSLAQAVGYLKVLIPQQNKAHNTSVTLKLNGTSVLRFSHASNYDSNLHVGLSAKGLASGTRTPISSDYSALQKGCQFDYRVQFSLDNSMWIDLGLYRAPSNNLVSYIPIGICSDGNVCSDNPIVKGQIEKQLEILKQQQEEQDRKNIEALKAWLEQALISEKSQDLSSELNSIAEFNENPELVSEEKNADIEGSLLNQRDTAHSPAANATLSKTNSERVAGVIESLNQKMGYSIPPDLMAAFEKSGLPPDILLNYGWVYAGALGLSYALKGQISQEQVDVLNGLKKIEQANFLTYHQDGIKESLRFVRYWDKATELGELGLRFSPMGDLLDFCELVTGRALCKNDGQLLSNNQRFLAAVGIVVGNRQFNGFVESELKTLFKELNAAEKIVDAARKIGVKTMEGVKDFAQTTKNILGNEIGAVGKIDNLVDATSKLAKEIRFTETTARRMEDVNRYVPIEVLSEAINFGKKVPDPQGAADALKYTMDMFKNGKKYELEVIYRESDKTILHFLYK